MLTTQCSIGKLTLSCISLYQLIKFLDTWAGLGEACYFGSLMNIPDGDDAARLACLAFMFVAKAMLIFTNV